MSHDDGELEDWPNCNVPDCPNKSTHNSERCYPHTFGLPLKPEPWHFEDPS